MVDPNVLKRDLLEVVSGGDNLVIFFVFISIFTCTKFGSSLVHCFELRFCKVHWIQLCLWRVLANFCIFFFLIFESIEPFERLKLVNLFDFLVLLLRFQVKTNIFFLLSLFSLFFLKLRFSARGKFFIKLARLPVLSPVLFSHFFKLVFVSDKDLELLALVDLKLCDRIQSERICRVLNYILEGMSWKRQVCSDEGIYIVFKRVFLLG